MYIDLVLCKFEGTGKPYLFQAPAFSYLDKGDRVEVETSRGLQMATVEASFSCDRDSESYRFALAATQATLPIRKVFSKVSVREFKYAEEEQP